MMTTTVPYAMATALVSKMCGVEVSVKAAENMIERRAETLDHFDQQQAERFSPYDCVGLPVVEQERPDDTQAAIPHVAYLEIDGVIPMTRENIPDAKLTPTQRRARAHAKTAKARGGKGRRYEIIGREVKNAVLYEDKDCANESTGRGCILKKTYVSHLGTWSAFALRLWVAMLRLRFDQAKTLVVLSDGAEWIRSLARWLPIPTLLILDIFHVKHRMWQVAHAVYGVDSPQAKQWADLQGDRIEAGHIDKVLHALRFLRPTRHETRELIDSFRHYLTENRDRMDYPAYKARGLRCSTAAVESANFHVTGSRLKLQGMRWSKVGAAHMASLRADLHNHIWEQRTRLLTAAQLRS